MSTISKQKAEFIATKSLAFKTAKEATACANRMLNAAHNA
jgi:hypothetical protein